MVTSGFCEDFGGVGRFALLDVWLLLPVWSLAQRRDVGIAVLALIMPEERFDYVRVAAVVLIGFGIAIAMLDRKFNRKR